MRYPDCQRADGDCSVCSLSNFDKDCHNNPVNQLAYLRVKKGLSQGQLSKMSGINVMMISRLERRERKIENTSLKTVISLADALGITDLRELL